MSELYLNRVIKNKEATIGIFSLDTEPLCWSLEDTIRKTKIYGGTAIPDGRYQLIPHEWKGIIVPHLLKVPFYEGILIHPLNFPEQTEGCIGPGYKATFKTIEDSRAAFKDLMSRIYPLMEKDEFFITIKGGYPVEEWEQK